MGTVTADQWITPNHNWYTYDTEVFKHDFVVVFKNKRTGKYTVFHNDNVGVREFIQDDAIYCGFNSKGYDQYIIKAICAGFCPEEIKQVNDWIIGGGQGWQCPLLQGVFFRFNNVDIMDDVQQGLSLKAIEGHLGMSIEETEVDFNLDRPLTQEELTLTIKYCMHDVDAAETLTDIRVDYLRTKRNLGQRAGVDIVKALSATNAKLTAMMLGAVKQEWHDGRDYVYPSTLDLSVIPKKILDFFDSIHDMSIPDDVLFKTSRTITIGGMLCKYAWGGVHGSVTCYYEEETENRVIQNRDVSSLYPSLIELYNYLSRNVPNPQLFYDIRKDRIQAKHTGDKQTATDLKLPLNTVSGAQENQYNDLYDPLPTRSMRISGQLFLTVLAMKLLTACKTIKLLNLNTDGLMYSVDKSELHIVDAICAEWERQTRFELETDEISKVWIKDVNNLLFIDTKGKVKTVGGYLNYGISVKGAWSINNNATIVKKAVIDYFTKGIPVETTIGECNDIFAFQIIAKAGKKYREAYHLVNGVQQPVQKVNRVYATSDERYGKIYKVKAEDSSTAKIEMLPEHCIIDNDNQLTIDAIDKTFYIEMAIKRINDFLGIKPEKNNRRKSTMATTSTPTKDKAMNVYQRLLRARAMFLGSDTKKSGKNMNLAFKYFELDDIVPVATKIFEEVGLISLVSFTTDTATMTMVNVDNGEDNITFSAPFNQITPIVSNSGKQVTNEMQALGSSITYMRRYLYMIALDICEPDSVDGAFLNAIDPHETAKAVLDAATQVSVPTPVAPKPIPTTPAAPEKPLTDSNGNASETQIRQLKDLLIKLREKVPTSEATIAEIAVQTQGFTVISKADCEKLIVGIMETLSKP